MTATQLNQRLQEIYQTYIDLMYRYKWLKGVSAPLLMSVFEAYERMERKILFVGQETHSWGRMDEHASVEALQTKYAAFDLGKSADYGDGKPNRYLISPFWNFSRAFFYNLNKSAGDVSKKTNGFLWTNIFKFDSNTTTPTFDLQQQNAAGFELLNQEIAILQPDVVVFLTGRKYDHWLDQLYKPERESVNGTDSVWLLHSSTQLLPTLTFQTQHPRTLSMQKSYHSVLASMTELANR
ncbi:uracil-DNA glycosylase family protein [Spirosoma horti]